MPISCVFGFHEWAGCKCKRCGLLKDDNHLWDTDCEHCARCGKSRSNAHQWNECKCTRCGRTRNGKHDFLNMELACSRCGKAADIEERFLNGSTLLHLATQSNRKDIVDRLLARGARVDAADDLGTTPLMLACLDKERTPIAESLLAAGADASAQRTDGETALGFAAYRSVDMVRALLKAGANPNAATHYSQRTPLMSAAYQRETAVVRELLAAGANVNASDRDGSTALMNACCSATGKDYEELVQILLTAGADANAQDKQGCTPLMHACNTVYPKIVKTLLTANPDLSLRRKDGMTATMIASHFCRTEMLEMIAAAGTGPDQSPPTMVQGYRVFEARSPQEIRNETSGRTGQDIPPQAEELLDILLEARAWGLTHHWPPHEQYPQSEKIRSLGMEIHQAFGFDGMQRVAYFIDARNADLTPHLTQFWNGIENWQA